MMLNLKGFACSGIGVKPTALSSAAYGIPKLQSRGNRQSLWLNAVSSAHREADSPPPDIHPLLHWLARELEPPLMQHSPKTVPRRFQSMDLLPSAGHGYLRTAADAQRRQSGSTNGKSQSHSLAGAAVPQTGRQPGFSRAGPLASDSPDASLGQAQRTGKQHLSASQPGPSPSTTTTSIARMPPMQAEPIPKEQLQASYLASCPLDGLASLLLRAASVRQALRRSELEAVARAVAARTADLGPGRLVQVLAGLAKYRHSLEAGPAEAMMQVFMQQLWTHQGPSTMVDGDAHKPLEVSAAGVPDMQALNPTANSTSYGAESSLRSSTSISTSAALLDLPQVTQLLRSVHTLQVALPAGWLSGAVRYAASTLQARLSSDSTLLAKPDANSSPVSAIGVIAKVSPYSPASLSDALGIAAELLHFLTAMQALAEGQLATVHTTDAHQQSLKQAPNKARSISKQRHQDKPAQSSLPAVSIWSVWSVCMYQLVALCQGEQSGSVINKQASDLLCGLLYAAASAPDHGLLPYTGACRRAAWCLLVLSAQGMLSCTQLVQLAWGLHRLPICSSATSSRQDTALTLEASQHELLARLLSGVRDDDLCCLMGSGQEAEEGVAVQALMAAEVLCNALEPCLVQAGAGQLLMVLEGFSGLRVRPSVGLIRRHVAACGRLAKADPPGLSEAQRIQLIKAYTALRVSPPSELRRQPQQADKAAKSRGQAWRAPKA